MNTKSNIEKIVERVLQRTPVELNQVTHTYAVISTPRCGSSMFVDKLKSCGKMGNPLEWFNNRFIRAYRNVTGMQQVDFGAYLTEIIRHTASESGVFGVNFHVDQYFALRKRSFDVFAFLKFDKIYEVKRQNKLAQAVSLSKARLTDVWSSTIDMTPEDLEIVDKIPISAVLQELHLLAKWVELFDKYFAPHVDRTFIYEEVVKDKSGKCFLSILEDFGQCADGCSSFETKLKKQSGRKDEKRIKELEHFIHGT